MNDSPHKTIITNLSYETANKIIDIHKDTLTDLNKVVNQESILLTPMVWQVILKNKAREFVRFKIFVHNSKNHEIQIKYTGFPVCARTKKLMSSVQEILKSVQNGV